MIVLFVFIRRGYVSYVLIIDVRVEFYLERGFFFFLEYKGNENEGRCSVLKGVLGGEGVLWLRFKVDNKWINGKKRKKNNYV